MVAPRLIFSAIQLNPTTGNKPHRTIKRATPLPAMNFAIGGE